MLQYQNRGALARETGLVTTQPHKDEALVAPRFCGVKLRIIRKLETNQLGIL